MNTTYTNAFESAGIDSSYSIVLKKRWYKSSMNIIKKAYINAFESTGIGNTYSSVLESASIGHNNLTYTHTLFQQFLKRCNRAFF